jgi:DNA-binding LytR/AlgR family response regulator
MSKAKVYIVEDEILLAKDLENILKSNGYNVVGVSQSGEEFLEKVVEERPNIVLMDIMLKGKITGIEAAKKLREMLDIPVIFLTAYSDENTVEKAKESFPYGYIIKPFREKELITTIEVALNKYQADQEIKKERDLLYNLVSNKNETDCIFVRADYRLNKISFKDIYFVEAMKDYVTIHTSDNMYTVHSTMKEMQKILPEKEFVRVHRSYIVRIDKIYSIKYPDIVIENKMKVIPIGGLYRKELYRKLNLL